MTFSLQIPSPLSINIQVDIILPRIRIYVAKLGQKKERKRETAIKRTNNVIDNRINDGNSEDDGKTFSMFSSMEKLCFWGILPAPPLIPTPLQFSSTHFPAPPQL